MFFVLVCIKNNQKRTLYPYPPISSYSVHILNNTQNARKQNVRAPYTTLISHDPDTRYQNRLLKHFTGQM